MAIDYSNLAKNPELYVDISNLAIGEHDAKFNLSDLRGVQEGLAPAEVEGDSGDQGPSGAGPLPEVPHEDPVASPEQPQTAEVVQPG